ncbi:hypothetical protein GN241_11145 [Rhodobacteraceae bacterium IMCC1335]
MLEFAKDFIAQIDTYCRVMGISASTYGERAMNDRSFVHQVRSGARNPSLRTIDRNGKYMAAHPPVENEDAA